MNQAEALNAILKERKRQDIIHPKSEDYDYFAVLIEEVGEVARAIQNEDYENLQEELVQVAAVAIRWLEEA